MRQRCVVPESELEQPVEAQATDMAAAGFPASLATQSPAGALLLLAVVAQAAGSRPS